MNANIYQAATMWQVQIQIMYSRNLCNLENL